MYENQSINGRNVRIEKKIEKEATVLIKSGMKINQGLIRKQVIASLRNKGYPINNGISNKKLAGHIRKHTGRKIAVKDRAVIKRYYIEYISLGNPLEKKVIKLKKKKFVQTDDFLQSYQWRRTRVEALKNNNGCCELCGRSKKDGIVLHVDHIKPRKKYPELALDVNNLQVLCNECNHGKGNWDETDWREDSFIRDYKLTV